MSCAGLGAVLALAARCGLAALVADRVPIAVKGGANAAAKIAALVAGMVAGADCIDDMDLLRHGGMGRVFTDGRAPLTLGTFAPVQLRSRPSARRGRRRVADLWGSRSRPPTVCSGFMRTVRTR